MGRLEKALERMKSEGSKGIPVVPRQPIQKPASKPVQVAHAQDKPIGSSIQQVTLDTHLLHENHVITDGSDSTVTTAYKMLRTRILQRMQANNWQSLAITSASPGDGKTLTAINLAISLAGDVNHSVCLVDLDLRHSSVARYMGLQAKHGTSDCLRRGLPIEEALIKPNIDRLMILPNTQIESHSSELLSSPEMYSMAQRWVLDDPGRLIIYDMPPLLAADDMLAFAPFIDAVLMVVSEQKTLRTDVIKSRELLENTNVIGTVLNCSDERTAAYY